jgi:hypothetical protein
MARSFLEYWSLPEQNERAPINGRSIDRSESSLRRSKVNRA